MTPPSFLQVIHSVKTTVHSINMGACPVLSPLKKHAISCDKERKKHEADDRFEKNFGSWGFFEFPGEEVMV